MITAIVCLIAVIVIMMVTIAFLIAMLSVQNREMRDWHTPVEPVDLWSNAEWEDAKNGKIS